jgi:Cys-tRNA(Pro) deacylase
MTPALRQLTGAKVDFTVRAYAYEDKGGTSAAARELGVDEHQVIKTLVFEDETGRPMLVLMHGDRQVSTKALARILGVKTVQPVTPEKAFKHTGYQVGGISPFGTRNPLTVLMEAGIADLDEIYINAGKRGLLVRMKTQDLIRVLKPQAVSAAV